MVRAYERAGIAAVCMEDKVFPKMNSFVATNHDLLDTDAFCRKLQVAKSTQHDPDFYLIARTEALINGLGADEALRRCHRYVDAGADAVLVHSKAASEAQIVEFLANWDGRAPVVIVPTTYPGWGAEAAHRAGVSVVIYANQGLRATVQSVQRVLRMILDSGTSAPVETDIAPFSELFALQRLEQWREVEA